MNATTTIHIPSEHPFEAPAPAVHHKPLEIAPGTYVIQQLVGEGQPIAVYFNSMVILGEEPIVVDTGTPNNRQQWFEDVLSLVDPDDVRWVYISHDDHDHVGNLPQAMQLFKNARIVSSMFQCERLAGDLAMPLERLLWLNDGESFSAGDRTIAAIRPPVFDSPTTRGLYDSKTGVYWSSDCFVAPVPYAVGGVDDLDRQAWQEGFQAFNMAVSPWISLVDVTKFNAQVARIAELDISVISGGHTPPIRGKYIAEAIDLLYKLPYGPPFDEPNQSALDEMLAAVAVTA